MMEVSENPTQEKRTKLWDILKDLFDLKKPKEPKPKPESDDELDGEEEVWDCDEEGHVFGRWMLVSKNEATVKATGATIYEINQQRTCNECGFTEFHYHRSDGR